jgi:ribulose-5-phosphate 4-epimerase/fuculose-1-phosphate aldolase
MISANGHDTYENGAHSHSVNGKAWSARCRLLEPITRDMCAVYEDHALGEHKAMILRNHGLPTVGGGVEEAAW